MTTTSNKSVPNTKVPPPARYLPESWELPRIFHERLGTKAGAQRAMFHEGHLLLILHEVPRAGDDERQGLLFWRDRQGNWRTSFAGAGQIRLTELLDRYVARVDELEAKVERAADATDLYDVLKHATPLRRAAANLAAAMQQAREAVGGKDLIALRDRAAELASACDLLTQDAKHALDYAIARQAEAQTRLDAELARSAERLNRLAAVFLPLTLLASLFGMNLPSGLESASPVGFWLVVLVGGSFGLGLGAFLARTGRAGGPAGQP